jgi:hypothetical protein
MYEKIFWQLKGLMDQFQKSNEYKSVIELDNTFSKTDDFCWKNLKVF